jgi:hypothetical protein
MATRLANLSNSEIPRFIPQTKPTPPDQSDAIVRRTQSISDQSGLFGQVRPFALPHNSSVVGSIPTGATTGTYGIGRRPLTGIDVSRWSLTELPRVLRVDPSMPPSGIKAEKTTDPGADSLVVRVALPSERCFSPLKRGNIFRALMVAYRRQRWYCSWYAKRRDPWILCRH